MKRGDKKKKGAFAGGLSDLYTPEAEGAKDEGDMGARLLADGMITGEQLASAQRMLKQSPGKHLAEILVEMGTDEAAVQELVADAARLPFRRVKAGDYDSYDGSCRRSTRS